MITLYNASPQPFVVSLYCQLYCKKGAPCSGTRTQMQQQVRLPTGESGVRVTEQCQPPSIRIEPKQQVDGLHPAVLEIPQVHDAVQQRRLVVRHAPAAEPTPASFSVEFVADESSTSPPMETEAPRSKAKGMAKKMPTPAGDK